MNLSTINTKAEYWLQGRKRVIERKQPRNNTSADQQKRNNVCKVTQKQLSAVVPTTSDDAGAMAMLHPQQQQQQPPNYQILNMDGLNAMNLLSERNKELRTHTPINLYSIFY